MTGTNHSIVGALIGITVGMPIVAIPIAFMSHFLLDAMPHFGEQFSEKSWRTKMVWGVDIVGLVILVILFAIAPIENKWVVGASAFAAFSPDIAWIYRFIVLEKLGTLPPPPKNALNAFHARIQTMEFRNGYFVEFGVTSLLVGVIFSL